MTLLALDTASRRHALCVLADEDGGLLDHRRLVGRELDRELPPALAALLRDDLAAVACVLGPGSFTGLRVGVSFGVGLAMGLRIPIVPLPSLDLQAARSTVPATGAWK